MATFEEAQEMIFRVEGFGEVGYANLYAFDAFDGQKQPRDLAVGESSEGKFCNPTSDKRPERVTRVK